MCIIANRIALPKNITDSTIKYIHETKEHLELQQLKNKIHTYFYGFDLDDRINKVLNDCETCNKNNQTKKYQTIAWKILGPFRIIGNKMGFLLATIYYNSNKVSLNFLENNNIKNSCKILADKITKNKIFKWKCLTDESTLNKQYWKKFLELYRCSSGSITSKCKYIFEIISNLIRKIENDLRWTDTIKSIECSINRKLFYNKKLLDNTQLTQYKSNQTEQEKEILFK